MNNRSRHLKYRKSIYRKKRIGVTLVISLVAAAVIFALFIILGNALHSRTQTPDMTGNTDTSLKETQSLLLSATTVNAYALPIIEDGSTFSSRLASISDSANAVCIALNTTDGTLLYRSALASSLSHLSVHPDASALSSVLTSIERNGFYTSAALYVPSFSNDDSLLRDVELATWGAISCEAFQEGVGDILLIARALESEDIDKICAIADNVHSNIADAIIGFSLSDSILSDENSIALIKKLSEHFNYISLDTTVYKADEDPIEFIESKVSTLQLELMYYKMRVLLPHATDATVQQQYVDAVKKYSISSWQILP